MYVYAHACLLLAWPGLQAGQHSAAAGMGASGGSLMDSPILLFGCADGVVRGLNLRGLQVRACVRHARGQAAAQPCTRACTGCTHATVVLDRGVSSSATGHARRR